MALSARYPRHRTYVTHARVTNQKVQPTDAWYVLGATKWVPLNVERKLYKASVLVRLMMLNRRRSFDLSPRSRLSVPIPTSNRCRGATRLGLFRGSPAP